MEKIKLFCIPYSGGSASVYYKWKRLLNERIILCPVELAGRGRRMREPFYEDVAEAREDISEAIRRELSPGEPYAIYGHSMGALLAFETYYSLKEKGVHEPVHIFFSGRKAPNDEMEKTEYYSLPEHEFLEVVFRYGGNTKEILQNRDLLDMFVPILRADFKIAEIYEYQDKKDRIMCDMSIVNGRSDLSVAVADMTMWNDFAGRSCKYHWINGSHFFITENCEDTANLINQVLLGYEAM